MTWTSVRLAATWTAALTLCLPSTGWSQEKAISIELNDATNVDSACRVVFVAVNNTGVALDKTTYIVVSFDASGKVGKSLTFDFGRLQVSRTKVVQFDLPGQTCEMISRLLVNDVSECSVEGKPSEICIEKLTTSNRTKIEFGL